MTPKTLAGAERQAARLEGLLDLLDRLATEVRDRGQLGLRVLDEVAHRLDARPLEAVVGPHAQLELLDQDVVHPAGARRARAFTGEKIESIGITPIGWSGVLLSSAGE